MPGTHSAAVTRGAHVATEAGGLPPDHGIIVCLCDVYHEFFRPPTGEMRAWILAVLCLAAATAILGRRRHRDAARRRHIAETPRIVWPKALDAFEKHAPQQVATARRAAAAFEADFQRTFSRHASHVDVRTLFAHRAVARAALSETRMRLPNDLVAERTLASATDDLDARMLDHIEDARQRVGAHLLHPGPLDDAWYGAWYRGSNDVVV